MFRPVLGKMAFLCPEMRGVGGGRGAFVEAGFGETEQAGLLWRRACGRVAGGRAGCGPRLGCGRLPAGVFWGRRLLRGLPRGRRRAGFAGRRRVLVGFLTPCVKTYAPGSETRCEGGEQKKHRQSVCSIGAGVGVPGFEPGKAGPESAVLPLHHTPSFWA